MRRNRKCSSNKKSNGCNGLGNNNYNNGMNNNYNNGMNNNYNNGCNNGMNNNYNNGMNNNYNNAQNQCNQYKQLAQQKCDQAENINCKANKIAQQAVAAEQQAQALKQQAQQQCQNANNLWDQYNQLAQQGMCLMQQAQDCLAKSAECYANLYSEQQGCNLDDYGTPVAANAATNNMTENTPQPYVSWEVLNAWNQCMEHKHGYNNGCGHGCNNCGCGCH